MGINETIIKELKKYLDSNNMSAAAFAKKINVNRSSITRFLEGGFSGSGKLLEKIAKGTDGEIKYLKKSNK